MPSFRDFFSSRFLKAADLGNSRVIATIRAVPVEEFPDGSKPVLDFVEPNVKPLVAGSKTNCRAVAQIAGTDDYTRWPGVRIQLYASTTEFRGVSTPCVRIEPPTGGQTPPAAPSLTQPRTPNTGIATDTDSDVGF